MVEFLLILAVVFFVTGIVLKIVGEQMNQKAVFYNDIVAILQRAQLDLALAMKEMPEMADPVEVWGCIPCRRINLVNERCPLCRSLMKPSDPRATIARITYATQRRS